MRGFGLFVIIVIVIAVGTFFLYQNSGEEGVQENVEEIKDEIYEEEVVEEKKGNTYEVDIKNFAFVRSLTRVMEGDTVIWTNKDSVEHSIVTKDEDFGLELLAPGETYSYTFNELGRFAYNCGIHPYMKGTIVVYKE